MPQPQPVLSVTMPTRNRPELLERALRSVVGSGRAGGRAGRGGRVRRLGRRRQRRGWSTAPDRLAGRLPVRAQSATLPLVDNMNRAVEIATGEWVMQLDDDDYLLPGAGEAMLEAIQRAGPEEAVLLFGVEIVDGDGVRRREQRFRHERYLEPREALRRLLRNSSFVREPTAVVRRTAMEEEGLFDTSVGGARRHRHVGAAVRPLRRALPARRPPARTPSMRRRRRPACGTPTPSGPNSEIFDRAVARGVVPERTIRRWQADWYHQFILAGAYRRLRVGQRAEAREVLRLFDLPEVRDRGVSPKWLPVRVAFTAATAGARRKAS